MKTNIYGLCDPRDGALRYVGKTVRPLEKRMVAHLGVARRGEPGHKNNWLRQLLSLGLEPEAFLIEVVEGNGTQEECYHIAQFRWLGCDLTNGTDGGEGAPGRVLSEESKRKMGDARRGKRQSQEARAKIAAARRLYWNALKGGQSSAE